MEYIDQTDYVERAERVNDLMTRQKSRLDQLDSTDRSYLQRYYTAALTASDQTRYRNDQLKLDPNIELLANKAYERMLAELGIPPTLPRSDGARKTGV